MGVPGADLTTNSDFALGGGRAQGVNAASASGGGGYGHARGLSKDGGVGMGFPNAL